MAQETNTKSEGGQTQRTEYGQNGRPDQEQSQGTAEQLQGSYEQSQLPSKRTDSRPQRQSTPHSQSQVPPQGTGSRPQSQGALSPQVHRTIYGQDDGQMRQGQRQPQRTVYGQGQALPPRTGSRPQNQRKAPQRTAGGRPQASGEKIRAAYGQDSQAQDRAPYGQGGQAQGRAPYGQNGQAQGRAPYGQGGQAQGRAPYSQNGQGGQMQGRAPYSQGGQVRGRVPYGQGGQAQGRAPYGQNGQAQGRTPYSQNGQGGQMRGRAPYGQSGQAQGRVPYGQDGRPGNGQSYVPGTMVQRRDGRIPVQTGLSGRRMTEESKKMFRSSLFLIIAVLCSVFAVTTMASVFLQELSFSQVVNILANFDAPTELMAYANRILSFMSGIGNGVIVFSLILHLPEFLLCAGFWILFATAGDDGEPMPGTGFTCTKIYIIIKMIVMCIAMLIGLIMAVVFAVSAWVSVILEAKIVSAVFLAAMIVLTMMVIMYFFCLLHTVKVCRANAVQGEDFSSVSRYAAVLTILAAAASFIGLLSAIVNEEMAGILSFSCKIGWMVLAGVWILLYRKKINRDEEEE